MKRKVKRYSAGDKVEGDYESSDDAKNLISAAEREAVEFEGEKIAKPLREAAQAAKAEPMKMASFGEAFKEARGRGDKTFEYMGKKYTTEMAGAKKPAAAAARETSSSAPDASGGRRGRTPTIFEKLASSSRNPTNPRLRRELAEGTKIRSEMKKGGKVSSASSRADGIAQRGKTRGRII